MNIISIGAKIVNRGNILTSSSNGYMNFSINNSKVYYPYMLSPNYEYL